MHLMWIATSQEQDVFINLMLLAASQERTRKPRTGEPPGKAHTSGTAITLVRSSQMVSMRPASPCGISGNGMRPKKPLIAPGIYSKRIHPVSGLLSWICQHAGFTDRRHGALGIFIVKGQAPRGL